MLFKSGFSARFKEWLSQLPSLWPSTHSLNKTWGRICFQRTLWIFSIKSDQNICTAACCASQAAKTTGAMLYRDKGRLMHLPLHSPKCWTRPLSTNIPKSCWDLLAAEMPLLYSTLAPVLPALLHCHFSPLFQHHCPPNELGDYLNNSSCCAAPHWKKSKLTKHASPAPLSSGTEGWGSKWAGLRLMSYLREFGRGERGRKQTKKSCGFCMDVFISRKLQRSIDRVGWCWDSGDLSVLTSFWKADFLVKYF